MNTESFFCKLDYYHRKILGPKEVRAYCQILAEAITPWGGFFS